MLAELNLLTLSLLIPSDLGKCFCLCGAGLLKLQLAELPGDGLHLLGTLGVGIVVSSVSSMSSVSMVTKPSRRPSCKGGKGEKEEILEIQKSAYIKVKRTKRKKLRSQNHA